MNVSCSYLHVCKVYVIKKFHHIVLVLRRHYFFWGGGGVLSLTFFGGGVCSDNLGNFMTSFSRQQASKWLVFSRGQKRSLALYVQICRLRYNARREDVQMIVAQARRICACVAHGARQLAATLIHGREPRAFSRRTSDLEQVVLHSNVPNVQENAWKQHTLWHQQEKKAVADTSPFPLQFLHFHF